MALFDLQIPFFVPVWRRIAVIAVCFGWGALEYFNNEPFWGALFCGLGVLSVWQLFFAGWPSSDKSKGQ